MLHPARIAAVVVCFGILLSACAKGGDAAQASNPSTGASVSPAEFQSLLAAADPDKGQVLFLQCRACHSLEAGGPNKVGPNLHGVFGRKAGMTPGYAYSDALTQASIVWSGETLNEWLLRPSDFLPGNRMVFVGIRKPEDRANLIAYLQRETGAK